MHTKHLLALVLALAPLHAESAKPNVLFIAVDDMRCDLGCYGVSHVKSPNLDRLASSGVLFTRAYCQQAVCNPSRVSLMTGLRPDSSKVWDLPTEMRTVIPDVVTLPQHFRKGGYRALGFGKIYHNPFPDDVSWDEPHAWPENTQLWSPEAIRLRDEFKRKMRADGKSEAAIQRMRALATEAVDITDSEHFDGAIADQGIAAMKTLAAGKQPFFLAVGFTRPHLPFVTPRKYWDLYDRAKIPLAENGHAPHGAPALADGGFYELRDYMDYSDAPWPTESPLTEAQQRELKHGYYASISFTDAQVGRLLDELDRLDLAKNTIVVLWSDHGWKLGEHGSWCKQTNYEIDTRAPLMVRAPGAKSNGKKCDALVEFVDIYPTLCDLAGLSVPETLEGRSFAPLLEDVHAKHKDAAFSQFPRKHEGRDYMGYTMRTDRYRYVEWLDATSGSIAAQELYDHENDAAENENIAVRPEYAARLKQLSAQMWAALPRPEVPLPFVKSSRTAAASDSPALLKWHPANDTALPASKPAGDPVSVTFVNSRPDSAELVWLGPNDTRKTYATLKQDESFSIRSRPGAVWLVRDANGKSLGHFMIEKQSGSAAKGVVPKP